MCPSPSFAARVRKTINVFSLHYNQLFYMLLEWSTEYLKFLKTSPSIFECILYQTFSIFLCYSNMITNRKFWCQCLTPNSEYKLLNTLFSFSYDLLPSESFLLMNKLCYCTDLQVSQIPQQIFLYY